MNRIHSVARQTQILAARDLVSGLGGRHIDRLFKRRGTECPRVLSLHEAVSVGGFSDEKEILTVPYFGLTHLECGSDNKGTVETTPRTPAGTLQNGTLSVTIDAEVGNVQRCLGLALSVTVAQNTSLSAKLTLTKGSTCENGTNVEICNIFGNGPITDGLVLWLFSQQRASGQRMFQVAEVRKTMVATVTPANFSDITMTLAADVMDVGAKIQIFPMWVFETDVLRIANLFTPEDYLAVADGSPIIEDRHARTLPDEADDGFTSSAQGAYSPMPGAQSPNGGLLALGGGALPVGGLLSEEAGVGVADNLPLTGSYRNLNIPASRQTVRTR